MNDRPGLTFNQRLSQNHQSGLNSANPMKSSVIVQGTKNPNQGLTFATQRPQTRTLSQSMITREGPNDIETFMKDIRTKFLKIDQVLYEHDGQLKDIRAMKENNKSFPDYTLTNSSSTDSFSIDMARNLRNECDNNIGKLRNTLYQQIDRLRAEINQGFPRKNDLDFTLNKIENKIIDTIKNNNYSRDISDLREKINLECRGVYDRVFQDINTKINNHQKLSDMEQHISELRRKIDTLKQELKPTVFTSNQKFYSPRLVKYKEVIQKLPNNTYDKPGQEIIINEVIYYLDKEGKLLDSTHHYLVDKNNKEIQLDYKQLTILNVHDMLS